MIFVLDLPQQGAPHAWFAFDKADLARKQLSMGTPAGTRRHIYWNEAQALAAFEGGDPLIAGAQGWRARRALQGQLVALDVLADDC